MQDARVTVHVGAFVTCKHVHLLVLLTVFEAAIVSVMATRGAVFTTVIAAAAAVAVAVAVVIVEVVVSSAFILRVGRVVLVGVCDTAGRLLRDEQRPREDVHQRQVLGVKRLMRTVPQEWESSFLFIKKDIIQITAKNKQQRPNIKKQVNSHTKLFGW